MMRDTVAGQKTLQANDATRIRRADQHRAANTALDQAYPSQDQSAHDAFAEIGLGNQKRAQSFRRDQKRFDIALGMTIDQRNTARELPDFGEELSWSLIDHRRDVTEPIALGDRNVAGQDHEHARSGFTRFEQLFTVLVTLDLAKAPHARHLIWRERRKRLLVTRKRASQRRDGYLAWFGRIERHFGLSCESVIRKSGTGIPLDKREAFAGNHTHKRDEIMNPALFRRGDAMSPRYRSWRPRLVPAPAISAA